jgi:hypothetical protein
MARKSTGRNRRGISLSIDNDIADRLQELNSRERADIVNAIFRDHLDDYIGKQTGNKDKALEVAKALLDEGQLRQIIREEFTRIGVSPGAERSPADDDRLDDSGGDTGLMDDFLGMRRK